MDRRKLRDLYFGHDHRHRNTETSVDQNNLIEKMELRKKQASENVKKWSQEQKLNFLLTRYADYETALLKWIDEVGLDHAYEICYSLTWHDD